MGSSNNTNSTIPKTGNGTPTTIGDLTKKVPVQAKGVTDTEIRTDAAQFATPRQEARGSFPGKSSAC